MSSGAVAWAGGYGGELLQTRFGLFGTRRIEGLDVVKRRVKRRMSPTEVGRDSLSASARGFQSPKSPTRSCGLDVYYQ